MLEENGPKKNAATDLASVLRGDRNARVFEQTSRLRAAALPYEAVVYEEMSTYKVRAVIIDLRYSPPRKMAVVISSEKAMNELNEDLIMKAVLAGKKRLQEKLAQECSDPEIRLWAAENRDVDLMDNSPIPPRIRTAYEKSNGAERQEIATEVSIMEDYGPVATPRPRKIIRKRAKLPVYPDITGDDSEEKKVSVRTVVGAQSKETIRKPRCQNRVHDEPLEMVYHAEEGIWRCSDPNCKMITRPKDGLSVGKVKLGRGRLDLRVVFKDSGEKPSAIFLVSDDNVALDITELVDDMDKFMQYSRLRQHVIDAKTNGDSTKSVDHKVTIMLRLDGMKLLGLSK